MRIYQIKGIFTYKCKGVKNIMKKNFLRFFSLFLVLMLLTSCGKSITANSPKETVLSETNSDEPASNGGNTTVSNSEYNFSIYDDNGRTYTEDELKVQEDFNNFLNDFFIESVTSNYVNLLFTVENPEDMGITIDNVTWGDYSIEAMKNSEADTKELYDELTSYDYDSLDFEGRLIYDTLKTTLENDLIGCKYWYFAENFSPLDGVQTSIPIMLAEIEFSDKEDIDNYLLVSKDTKRLFGQLIEVEKYRSETYKIFLSDSGADDVINQCNEFINAPENVLISSFNSKIDEAGFLSDKEKEEYKKSNEEIVQNYIIPSFQLVVDTFPSLKGTRLYDSLSQYENGDEYYAYLVAENSGSFSPVSDLVALTEIYIDDTLSTFSKAGMADIAEFTKKDKQTDPKETLTTLAKKLTADFPSPATTNFELKYVPESLEASSSPAFYIIPPIDNIDKNIIYINGSDQYKDESLYSILAHEGYPGHLYQNTYFNNLNPNPIRSCLSFIGYTEGYAMYAERYAYDYKCSRTSTADLFKANDLFGYGIYSYIDFHVNYNGKSYDEICQYLKDLGYDEEVAKELYSIAINDPCVYHRYFMGLVQILELQKKASYSLGNLYSNINFNKFILEIGPTYFNIIEDYMDTWIEQIRESH